MHNHIICEQHGKLGIITLNSEKTLNSLSVPMIAELHSVLREWKSKDEIACIFLQGAGEKAFCAGGDVRKLHDAIVKAGIPKADSLSDVPPECLDFFVNEYKLDYEIHKYPKPIIVWAHGIVMGGGIGLACGASHRVVTEKSKFAMPEITIGLYPDVAGTWFLNRMPQGFGLYAGMTGARFSGSDCLFLGLADFLVQSSTKLNVIEKLSTTEWSSSRKENDALINELLEEAGAVNSSADSAAQAHKEYIAQFHNVQSVDEFVTLLNSAKGKSDWLDSGIKSFAAGSPSSAHIIFEQLRRGQNLSLEDVFRSELNLSTQCTLHPDFVEGVRALLVDKDNAPKWHPATLSDISKIWVNSYFERLWTDEDHPLKELGKDQREEQRGASEVTWQR